MKTKKIIQILFAVSVMLTVFISCKKTNNLSNSDDIIYFSVNKEFVLIRDTETLQESDDEISNHIDSIIAGLIDEEFISTGHKSFDLDNDNIVDISFEIIDLNLFNQNNLPDYLDSLAARVLPLFVEILDNSTYGYPDALSSNDQISDKGNWSERTSVLGTFMNAGQFQGNGEKYLGFRFTKNSNYNYGWIKIYCSQHNDTLRIIEFAYNNAEGNSINAGQKE
ncbi:MAG: hypothetical protein K8R54_04610 [Bacteroidales bacterium]|nr:hypothetical protein [Bacteroidales bacterium]